VPVHTDFGCVYMARNVTEIKSKLEMCDVIGLVVLEGCHFLSRVVRISRSGQVRRGVEIG
jgi:hypothetical protein